MESVTHNDFEIKDTVNTKLFQLLVEFADICKEAEIQYYLEGASAKSALTTHELPNGLSALKVSMWAEDLIKFDQKANEIMRENRFVESMLNNDTFPNFCMRYGSKETTDMQISLMHSIIYPGIHIDIIPLRKSNLSSFKYKVFYALESAWESTIVHKNRSLKRTVAKLATQAVCLVVGKNNYAKWLFKNLVKVSSGEGRLYVKGFWNYISKRRIKYYKNSLLGELYGHEFCVSSYTAFKVSDGEFSRSFNRFISAEIPFSDFLKSLDGSMVKNHNELQKTKLKYLFAIEKAGEKYGDPWSIVCRTDNRFHFWQKYMDKKQDILKSYESGDMEQTANMLKSYLSHLCKSKYPVCFDKDILDISLNLIKMKYPKVNVSKIEANIPKQHLLPINVIRY